MIDMIWFDFGGVLSPPIPWLFDNYARKTGLRPKAMQGAMCTVAKDLGVPMLEPIECAMLTEREWGARLRIALQEADPHCDTSAAQLETFGKQWFADVAPNQSMVAAVRALKRAGKSVGILTNNVVEWEPHWRAMVGLDDVVDIVVDSSKVRCRKPDARIFQIACERAGVHASKSLLIDDLPENVEAARDLGWNAILFTHNEDALDRLQRWTGVNIIRTEGALFE
ncbi:Haloacid dehalogenase [Burkholderia sp. 8Y]|uniref:HAD family hydrolase n=1 Tax=Burkholderia sp. 8Y TaxID=2653133 RepID=UPI0012EF5262|nr:HAD family phosphatase [Burkholderia sp. 8Y]VXC79400.1 Haloacid dehalogenase [Burkholderia sp. 8Y]